MPLRGIDTWAESSGFASDVTNNPEQMSRFREYRRRQSPSVLRHTEHMGCKSNWRRRAGDLGGVWDGGRKWRERPFWRPFEGIWSHLTALVRNDRLCVEEMWLKRRMGMHGPPTWIRETCQEICRAPGENRMWALRQPRTPDSVILGNLNDASSASNAAH